MLKVGYNLQKVAKSAKICVGCKNFPKSCKWIPKRGKSYKKVGKYAKSKKKMQKLQKMQKLLKEI